MITATWTCDYCGGEIESGHGWARLRVDGWGIDLDTFKRRKLDDERHYHAGEVGSCYRKVYDAVVLSEEWGPTLETIPTITGQAVAARRRKHTKPDGD